MRFLFNSKGRHVANEVNGQLHAPSGKNIGHYLEQHGIFIDMNGHYLGEVVFGNRIMYNISSPHIDMNFGVRGDYGDIGDYGDPGNFGGSGVIAGYRDIETPWLP